MDIEFVDHCVVWCALVKQRTFVRVCLRIVFLRVSILFPNQVSGCAQKSSCGLKKEYHGVGLDGFHPRVPLDLSDGCCGGILALLHKVEMVGTCPGMLAPTLFFLIRESTISERPTVVANQRALAVVQFDARGLG